MKNPWREGERGMSLVGGVVAIAVLGTILVSMDTIVSSSNTGSHAFVAATLDGMQPLGDVPSSPDAAKNIILSPNNAPASASDLLPTESALTKAKKDRCEALKKILVDKKAGPGVYIPALFETKMQEDDVTVEGSACVSAHVVGTAQQPELKCAGMTSKIVFGKEERKIVSTPSAGVEMGKCVTVGVEDADGKTLSGSDLGKAVNSLAKDEREAFDTLVETSAFDPNTNQTLLSAFEDQKHVAEQEVEATASAVKTADANVSQFCSDAGSELTALCGDYYDDLEAAKKDREAAEQELKKIQERNAKFQEGIKRLESNGPAGGTTGCAANPSKAGCPCPSWTRGTAIPNCTQVNNNTNNNTFPDRRTQSAPGAGGLGALGGLMRSLGLGGGQPSAGNQTPHSAGTCASGSAICSGNTIYSRNSQCVDTVVKYCEYGCSGNQCAQKPGSCSSSPSQPDASGCSGGNWKPTYKNGCVSGWQCVGSQGDGPAAEISCQPDVADVGMDVLITYSCSAGTSSGAGFTTNGAKSGATSTTITSVPANTNTATYTLTCTNNSLSSNTSCKVQVGKPTIVLVANPAEIEEDETSTLGWVTSGMSACVISSPDIEDFTNQNAHIESVNGTVETPELDEDSDFTLTCDTVGGGTREATVTIEVD